MKYLPPFEVLRSFLAITNVEGELMVSCSYENLIQMLRQMIIGVEVDESWYLQRYPDIAEAIELGDIGSAQEHFDSNGFAEGRLPYDIEK